MEPYNFDEIKNYLYDNIPLVSAMELEFLSAIPGEIRIKSPLQANINDKGTGFAGSIYSGLVLSGWSLVTYELRRRGHDPDVVVARSTVEYRMPIRSDFISRATFADPGELDLFLQKFEQGRKPGISVQSTIELDGEVAAHFEAVYHAWKK